MNERGKKPDDEMLITHLPPPAEMDKAGRDDAVRASGLSTGEIDRAKLGAELAAAPTEDQRRRIIESIQERFGNEVAEEIVSEARLAHRPDEGNNGGRLA